MSRNPLTYEVHLTDKVGLTFVHYFIVQKPKRKLVGSRTSWFSNNQGMKKKYVRLCRLGDPSAILQFHIHTYLINMFDGYLVPSDVSMALLNLVLT